MDYRDKVKVIKKDGTEHIIPASNMDMVRRVDGHNIDQFIPIPFSQGAVKTETKKPALVASTPQPKITEKVLTRDEMDYQARLLKIKNYHRMSDDTLLKNLKLAKVPTKP